MDKILCHSVISSDYSPTIDKNSVDPFGDGSGKALWKLDGNGTDVSGNYSMTAGTPSWTTGLDGQCASLTGATSQILYRGQELALQLTAHTLSCWVKLKATPTDYEFVLDNQCRWHGPGSTENEGSQICFDNVGKICGSYTLVNTETYTDSNGNTGTTYHGPKARSSFIATVGQWYHVVWVVNGNNGKLYIDGTLNSEVTTVKSINWSTSTSYYGRVCIGGLVLDPTPSFFYPLNGLVEQCRIFNRVLTTTEITALYNEI